MGINTSSVLGNMASSIFESRKNCMVSLKKEEEACMNRYIRPILDIFKESNKISDSVSSLIWQVRVSYSFGSTICLISFVPQSPEGSLNLLPLHSSDSDSSTSIFYSIDDIEQLSFVEHAKPILAAIDRVERIPFDSNSIIKASLFLAEDVEFQKYFSSSINVIKVDGQDSMALTISLRSTVNNPA